MISLITISCIAAAFAPVISKKLRANGISIASNDPITDQCKSGGDNYGPNCELCTPKYCIKCNLECPVGQYVDTGKCVCKDCKTTYGDTCKECDAKTCTLCNTSYYLKGLDGQIHTTCQLCGKTAGKDNICIDGINEQSPNYCENPPEGFFCYGSGLKACTYYDVQCTKCDSSQCKTCRYSYFYNASTKRCESCGGGCHWCTNASYCTGCSGWYLINPSTHKCEKSCSSVMPNCRSCSGNVNSYLCTECYVGYYLSNDKKSCIACTSISKCSACSSGKCTRCNAGYYVNSNGGCSSCSISNCAQCNTNGTCLSCNSGYHVENNACVSNTGDFSCSDANFMKLGKLCVTRRNMGDSSALPIPSTIAIATIGSDLCYSSTMKCCWKGKTSNSCNDTNGAYSGCGRTVCNYAAAKEICEKFNFGGLKWRLPTYSEIQRWYIYTGGLGANGLQLCSDGGTSEYSACGGGSCPVTREGCYPYLIWSGTEVSATGVGMGYVRLGNWYGESGSPKVRADSVRCVADMDD